MSMRFPLVSAAVSFAALAACSSGYVEEVPEDVGAAEQSLLATRVQAEAYARYSDTTSGNTGAACVRGSDGVDMETTSDTGGGCNVGWTAAGEWLEWDVSLPTAGTHSLTLRVASLYAGKTGKVTIDGGAAMSFEAPASGWQGFADRTFSNLNLSSGSHKVRVSFDNGSVNLNYLEFKGPDAPTSTARSIANNLEAESHDGMSGVQYETCSEGGQNAGWIETNDWIEWKISVPTSGSYALTTRSASTASASYAVLVDGTQVTTKSIANTGGWQNWQSFTTSAFNLNAGTRTLRVKFTSGGQNLNYVKVAAASTSPITWRNANLTWFTSYPDPGSEECIEYNGCTWAGYFAALDGQQPESWVAANNIAAVHEKDFNTYKLKTLRLRQNGREIDVKVYDMCSDSDCDGCCTRNAGGSNGFLIDLESYTKDRFQSGSGTVEWYCLDC
jgi:hypothetical protein